jgi:uncharacterized protein YaaQ
MSSVVISGNTSGTITLSAPDVAGTTTLTLPTTSGTLITTGGGAAGSFTTLTSTQDATFATSSGNVGIGITPSAWTSYKVLQFGIGTADGAVSSAGNETSVTTNAYNAGGWKYQSSSFATKYYQSNGAHVWQYTGSGTAGNAITWTEAMRITSSGTVLFGTTSAPNSGLFRAYGNASADFSFGPQTGVGTNAFVVYNAGTSTGVYLVAGNTSWTSSSDERVKDIIEPITNAAEKVSTLRTVIGKYKTDEDNVRRPFLIAQDIQAVLPEAVDASKPDNLGVQYTDVIPLLTAAIKEQQAIINELKTRITALEKK